MQFMQRGRFSVLLLQCFPQIIFTLPAAYSQQNFAAVTQPSWKTAQSLHKPRDYNTTALQKLAALNDYKRINRYLDNILIHRPVGTENHKKVGMYIKRTLEELGYKVDFDKFSQNTIVGDRTFRNVIATLDPLAPRRLVLACHYDSKDFRPNYEFMGATDSAVPCALMLDVAQSLNNYITNRSSEDVMVLLDLLGASKPVIRNYKETNYRPVYQLLSDTEKQLQKSSNCLNSIPNIFGIADTLAAVDDDHAPFHNRGVNVVHLIPIPFPYVWHNRADDRSALHQPTIENLATILRVFTAKYLGIRL